jgi:DNA primase
LISPQLATLVTEPKLFTAKSAKERREQKVFVDYLRNSETASAVAAFPGKGSGTKIGSTRRLITTRKSSQRKRYMAVPRTTNSSGGTLELNSLSY